MSPDVLMPNPRYDEVYHDGVTWLESLYSVDEIIRLGVNKEAERLKSLQSLDNVDRVDNVIPFRKRDLNHDAKRETI